jgi:hypothetical protein
MDSRSCREGEKGAAKYLMLSGLLGGIFPARLAGWHFEGPADALRSEFNSDRGV